MKYIYVISMIYLLTICCCHYIFPTLPLMNSGGKSGDLKGARTANCNNLPACSTRPTTPTKRRVDREKGDEKERKMRVGDV